MAGVQIANIFFIPQNCFLRVSRFGTECSQAKKYVCVTCRRESVSHWVFSCPIYHADGGIGIFCKDKNRNKRKDVYTVDNDDTKHRDTYM